MQSQDNRGLAPWLGWLLFLGLFVHWAAGYGTRWVPGRYWIPRALVAPDGLHYSDGAEIDPINLYLIRSDCQEEFLLVMLGLLSMMLVILVLELRKLRRLQTSHRAKAPRHVRPGP